MNTEDFLNFQQEDDNTHVKLWTEQDLSTDTEDSLAFSAKNNQSISLVDKYILSQEDVELLNLMVVKFKRDWKRIANTLGKKLDKKISPEVLRLEYRAYEGPKEKAKKFSREEDLKIEKYVKKYGVDWLKISEYFPGRCPLSISNRYYTNLKTKDSKTKVTKRDTSCYDKKELKSPSVSSVETTITSPKSLPELDLDLGMLVSDIKLEEYPSWMQFIDEMLNEC